MATPFQLFIETGGTFTDALAITPEGEVRRTKVLSSGRLRVGVLGRYELPGIGEVVVVSCLGLDSAAGMVGAVVRRLGGGGESEEVGEIVAAGEVLEGGVFDLVLGKASPKVLEGLTEGAVLEVDFGLDAPAVAAHLLTRTGLGEALPAIALRLATTRGTNALLTRSFAPVALFVTKGFADLLEIGTQARPDIFALNIRKPVALHAMTVEVGERLDAQGKVLLPLDEGALRDAANGVLERGIRSAAVVLAHSDLNGEHERAARRVLREAGFEWVSTSHELSAQVGLLKRAQTTVANAALLPVISKYLRGAAAGGLGGEPLLMASSGGLIESGAIHPKDMLFSGPASGVIGAAWAAEESGFARTISFDMGGTSTDVSRREATGGNGSGLEYVFEHQVRGAGADESGGIEAHVNAPALAVESVAAGGGSICTFDVHGGLSVGPASAGAEPGPACYGRGGPLTITDCNLLLGNLDTSLFSIPVFEEKARERAAELTERVRAVEGAGVTVEEVLARLVDLADEKMAQAIRTISVQRGYDPAEYALVAFGGAGGQHACGVAERLGMTTVVVPKDVGLLSARGLAHARVERMAHRQVQRELRAGDAGFEALVAEVDAEALRLLGGGGVIARRIVELRLFGQDAAIAVDLLDGVGAEVVLSTFAERYRAQFGYPVPRREVELVSVRSVAAMAPAWSGWNDRGNASTARRPAGSAGGDGNALRVLGACGRAERARPGRIATVRRDELDASREISGPLLILEGHGTTLVRAGWRGRVDGRGALVLTRDGTGRDAAAKERASPAAMEILTGRLYAIATDMGETLRRVSISTNVKERLDFSCAVLDGAGELVVNAPHLPVHLGSLGVTVRALKAAIAMGPGDVVLTNHPAFGGSHLPDVTVVTPVFAGDGTLVAFVASRAHHAEIGGVRPGSMPPDARNLAEEGVVLAPMYLVRGGSSCAAEVEGVLRAGAYPSRQPEENMADLAAQAAANQRGVAAIGELAGSDPGALLAAMRALTDRAERQMRGALAGLVGRTMRARETLDEGAVIAVRIEVVEGQGGARAVVDFAGSAGVHAGNFNAPAGVVRSAVMYCMRLLMKESSPLNEGLMRCIELRVPEGMLNPVFEADAERCPAVCAGNVETSQRVVDAVLAALGIVACSQGTMNNVIFGNARFGYYETVCGGSGAGPGFAGASAVHTHMTNTRITDVEVIERRYPVRIGRFAVRMGSGGAGAFAGGDGVVREYTFLEGVALSLLTQHRGSGPYGVAGGRPGATGEQWLRRASGEIETLGGVVSREVRPGETLVIQTPGGGGWGGVPEARGG